MQIKLFIDIDPTSIEAQVNAFLLTVTGVSVSMSAESQGPSRWVALVVYNP